MTDVKDPQHPAAIILRAELMASSAERVRNWLEQREKQGRDVLRGLDDEPIEWALLRRNDPLINLSLARFAASFSTLRELLDGAERNNKAVRLAIFSNQVAPRAGMFGSMPDSLLTETFVIPEGKLEAFVSGLDTLDVAALFSNPAIRDSFLTDFFEQKVPWQLLDEPRRLHAVATLYQNPRMSAEYKGHWDGWAEYSHNKVFDAAWELAAKLPPTAAWASQLAWLYDKTTPSSFSIEEPLQVAARWVPDPTDAERIKHEQEALAKGELGVFARMRMQIARLGVAKAGSGEARRLIANHEDPAVRAAFYREENLTLAELEAANRLDFLLSFEQLIDNALMWRTKETRKFLHDMAWDSKRDPDHSLFPQNMYNGRLEHYQAKNPEWFKDEDEQDTAVQPGASDTLSTVNDLARATHGAMLTVLKRITWIGWGVAIVLVVLLLRGR